MNSFLSQGKGFLSSQKDALQAKVQNEASGYVNGFTNKQGLGTPLSSSNDTATAPVEVESVADSGKGQGTPQPSTTGFNVLAGNISSPFGAKIAQAKGAAIQGYDMRNKLSKESILQQGKGLAAPYAAEGEQFLSSGRGMVQGKGNNEPPVVHVPPIASNKSPSSPNVPQTAQPSDPMDQQITGLIMGSPFGAKITQAKDAAGKGYDMRNKLNKNSLIQQGNGLTAPYAVRAEQFLGSGSGMVQGTGNNEPPTLNTPDSRGQPSSPNVPQNSQSSGLMDQQVTGLVMGSPFGAKITQAQDAAGKGYDMRNKLNKETLVQQGKNTRASYIDPGLAQLHAVPVGYPGNIRQTRNIEPKVESGHSAANTAPSVKGPETSIGNGVQLAGVNLGSPFGGKIAQARDTISSGYDMKNKLNMDNLTQQGNNLQTTYLDPTVAQARGIPAGFLGKAPQPSNSDATAPPSNAISQPTEEPQTKAFDNLGADLSMDNAKEKGIGFLSAKTGLSATQFQSGISGKTPENGNGQTKGEAKTNKISPEGVLGIFATASSKLNRANSSGDGSSSADDSGEKYFIARYEDTRGPSCSYTKGVIVRLVLIFLNTLTTVRAVTVTNNHFLWGCPPICAIFLALEYAMVVFKRLGKEWKWWLPCVVVYLATTLPMVCVLQLKSAGVDDNGVPRKSDIWTIVVSDATVYITIFARWMLQGGVVSLLSLATVLLDFLANASDVMDLLSLTDQIEVRTNNNLMIWVLTAWSLSFIKFIPLIERRAGENPKSLPGCIQRSCGPQFTDILQTLFSLLLLDGSFLVVRLYLMIAESVVTFGLIFFVIKNILSFAMQFYHLVGVCRTLPCTQRAGEPE